ncbi:hypothetical protein EIN_274680 [Entamoeba invadens IP1]|uniref:Acid phosphatase n=1 Tax=Entamoeba invadens IP1 TaxID=370355 RepID=A0A0A1U7C4_ENTIV|nr:hypothetical protein EIN_274680 [Entamoeba invadens IP1]ELP87881.1 hypothetical protein EIN_274680 [Entamoeba invadens IP1]|eukprot:XP_004254652.1 hypothetical protein EIN_274680 [Entamoeba invadens IP1]
MALLALFFIIFFNVMSKQSYCNSPKLHPKIVKTKQLKKIFIITRHGSRSPMIENNLKLTCNKTQNCKINELTDYGKAQMMKLGSELKEYLSSNHFDLNESKSVFKSTRTDRTIKSAESFLKGLFANNFQNYTENILKNILSENTNKFSLHLTKNDVIEEKQRERFRFIESTMAPFISNLAEKFAKVYKENFSTDETDKNEKKTKTELLIDMFDLLQIAECNNLEFLKSKNESFSNNDFEILWTFMDYVASQIVDPEIADLATKPLRNEISHFLNPEIEIKKSEEECVGGMCNNLRSKNFEFVSGHDDTLYPLMVFFKQNFIELPSLASYLMLEMFDENGSQSVRVSYNSRELKICQPLKTFCPLNEFLEWIK